MVNLSLENLSLENLLKKKDVVVILGLIFVALAVAKTSYQQQMTRYEEKKKQIETEKEKGLSLDRIIILNEKIKKAKAESWELADVNVFIERIASAGLESGIKIKNIMPEEKTDGMNYVLIPFSFSFEAAYRNLARLSKKFETYPMLTRIKKCDVSLVGLRAEEQKDSMLKVDMTIEAVFLK